MLLIVLRLITAIGARETVIIQIEITHAKRRLHVPMLGEQPLVAVAYAYARSPSLTAFILKVEYLQVGEVVGDERDVQPKEMSAERLAKPIPYLRMRPEMLHRAVVRAIIVLAVERIQPRFEV